MSRLYGKHIAIDRVTFSVSKGSTFGFLGPNGAGKTTTIKILLGLLKPSSGMVRVLGQELPDNVAVIRPRVGVLLDNSGIFHRLTVDENLRFFGRAYGLSLQQLKTRSTELLNWLGIAGFEKRLVGQLSTGERRKVGIARAFLHRPELVFLDEPTLGLDLETALALGSALERLARSEGVTVFLTTHNLGEVERLCDRVVVMNNGQIIADTTPPELASASRAPIVTITLEELPTEIIEAIQSLPGVREANLNGRQLRVTYEGPPDSARLLKTLVNAGVSVSEVHADNGELGKSFVELIRKERTN
jgi:ABC-2 type transport system ATP-binding protein